MIKIYLTIIFAGFLTLSKAQVEMDSIYANNVNAIVNHDGYFFNNEDRGLPGYEVPQGSRNHAIFSSTFWFAGVDINGQLKVSAQSFGGGYDLFPGALSIDGTAESIAPGSPYGVFSVKKSEIDNHIANYDTPGYITPAVIENWPAHGDLALNQSYYLAPFVDVDFDGNYIPSNGDYPKIKGHQAAFLILNDKQNIHLASGGDPLGIEIHLMFYQYDLPGDMGFTTFINMKIINRSPQIIYDFYVGCQMDADIGLASDDYIGFDSVNQMMYGYNGDLNDEGGAGGQPGYGVNPPAIGVTLLNRPVNYFMPGSIGGLGYPVSPDQFYNYMQGYWTDGTHLTYGETGYGGEVETNYIYDGNPNNPDEWSDRSAGNTPGDRRMMMSTHVPASFLPNQVLCFDYAVVYNGDVGAFENVNGLLESAANIRGIYNDAAPYCEDEFLGIEANEIKENILIYPNPSTGTFTVDLNGEFDLEIYSMDGRLVESVIRLSGHSPIKTQLSSGTYLLVFNQNNVTYRAKLIVE